jgi:acyl-[acyl-carrier-protein]-phospholipid O-acyltransferase / long-chain-fatty-acid--[acyl-carrier-protein] ligase
MTESDSRETPESAEQVGKSGATLISASFIGLLCTQLFGAANDNIFRWLVIGIGKQYVDKSDVSNVLMIGSICFVLPYLLFAAPAGYLADRYSKRTVIIGCKIAEIVIMTLGIGAILFGNLWLLMFVVFLMGAQSALYGPAKLGSIPELLKEEHISAANGAMGLVTVFSTVAGMAIGNILSDKTGEKGQPGWWISAIVVVSVAVVGYLASLKITNVPAAAPGRVFPWNPWFIICQTGRDLASLRQSKALLRVALGMMFFWALAGLAQMNIDQFAFEGGATAQSDIVWLLIALVIGVGLGNILAGIWSGGKVELGILPLGAAGIALSSFLLFTVEGTLIDPASSLTFGYAAACFFLFLLGVSAGLFDVPLNSYVQHRSPPELLGSILAAVNFLAFAGILLTSVLFGVMRYPFYEGSLNAVEVVQETPLDAQTLAEVKKFEAELSKPHDEREISDRLISALGGKRKSAAGLTPQQESALAHLFWAEMQAQKKSGEFIDLDQYIADFPKQETTIRQVYNEVVGHPLLSARQIFLICALATLPVLIYIVCLIPGVTLRFFVWLATHTIYRVRVEGRDMLPEQGGALLVANHVSWMDGLLLMTASSRPVRIVVSSDLLKTKTTRWLAKMFEVIPISSAPKAAKAALDEARAAILAGELVCIFPEGELTRSGQLQAFKPGLLEIVRDTGVPVIPTYLDELWGSIFSFHGGKFFWKVPRRWPYPVSIFFGQPLADIQNIQTVRAAVERLGATAVQERTSRSMPLPRRLLRQCRRRLFSGKLFDSMGGAVTGGMLLMRALILRRLLRRGVLSPDESFVGVLLPPSTGGAIVNAALALDRRISANLNYTLSADVMNACISQAGIKHVLTSHKVMEKLNYKIDAEIVYLEDFKESVSAADKLITGLQAFLLPSFLLERVLGLTTVKPDDVLTVIFTSGSTGEPKGVLLTQRNILSNVEAIDQVVSLNSHDMLLGILPFFHSFGYTVTLWAPLGLNVGCAYHFSPLEPKQVGKICLQHKCTVLLSTPTFLRSYMRKCTPEEFASLEVVVVGAEKMPAELAEAFEEKFGVRPVEGYGATELSPLVSVNVPPSRSLSDQIDLKEGTVGRPVPGVSAKVVDPDSGEPLPTDTPGMLLITGPNVMKGYHGLPAKTADVIQDGWYVTGDIAMLDADGFITITGRQSRFSKIGGEMVPHLRVEEEIQKLVGAEGDEIQFVVTAVPDARKGERLVVLYTQLPKTPGELRKGLSEAGLPNLWIPGEDAFVLVEQIPILGTGKLDLRGVKQLAAERLAGATSAEES